MNIEQQRIVVTGGSRGLGLGIVQALVARRAQVTVVARDPGGLAEVKQLGVATVQGDVTDAALADRVLRDVKPNVLVLNAGATTPGGLIHQHTWDSFSMAWNTDVQASFHWIKAALTLPLPSGSRVLVGSSGAAINGSPISGGYAGAKRTQWFMASYANAAAKDLGVAIHFQAVVPRQIIGETALGRAAAEGYARRTGKTVEEFLASMGAPLSPKQVGEHVATLLTDPAYATGVAYGISGNLGLHSLDS